MLIVPGIFALVLTGASSQDSSAREAAIRAAMVHCPGTCVDCPSWTDFSSPYGPGNEDEIHNICDGYTCAYVCDGQNEMDADEAELAARVRAEAIVAAADGAADEIAELIAFHPEVVTLNRERGAVQLIGCNGLVIGHLPLDRHTLTEISSDL